MDEQQQNPPQTESNRTGYNRQTKIASTYFAGQRLETDAQLNGSEASSNLAAWFPIRRNLLASLEANSELRGAMNQLHFNKTLSLARQTHPIEPKEPKRLETPKESKESSELMEASQLVGVAAETPKYSLDWPRELSKRNRLQPSKSEPVRHSSLASNDNGSQESKLDWGSRKQKKSNDKTTEESPKSSDDGQNVDPLNSMQSSSSSSYRSTPTRPLVRGLNGGDETLLTSRSESISLPERDDFTGSRHSEQAGELDNQDDPQDDDEESTTSPLSSNQTSSTLIASLNDRASKQISSSNSNSTQPDNAHAGPLHFLTLGSDSDDANESNNPIGNKVKASDLEIVSLNQTNSSAASVGLLNSNIIDLQSYEKPSLNWRFSSKNWQASGNKLANSNGSNKLDDSQYSGSTSSQQMVGPPIIRTIRFIRPPEYMDDSTRPAIFNDRPSYSGQKDSKFASIATQDDETSRARQELPTSWSASRIPTSSGFSPSSIHQSAGRQLYHEGPSFANQNNPQNLDYQQLYSSLSVHQTPASDWLSSSTYKPPQIRPITAEQSSPKPLQYSMPVIDRPSPSLRSIDRPSFGQSHSWQAANNVHQMSRPQFTNWRSADQTETQTTNSMNRWPDASTLIETHSSWPPTAALLFGANTLTKSSAPKTTTLSPKIWLSNGHNPAQHRAPSNGPIANSMVRAFAHFPVAHHPLPLATLNPTLASYTTNGHTMVGVHNQIPRSKEPNELDELNVNQFEQVASSPASFLYIDSQAQPSVSNMLQFAPAFSLASDPFMSHMAAIATMPASAFEDPSSMISTSTTRNTTLRPNLKQNPNLMESTRLNHKPATISSVIPLADPTTLRDAFGWPVGIGSEATRSLIKINHVAPPPSYLISIHAKPLVTNGDQTQTNLDHLIPSSPQQQESQYNIQAVRLKIDDQRAQKTPLFALQDTFGLLDSSWIHGAPSSSIPFDPMAHYPAAQVWHPQAQRFANGQASSEQSEKTKPSGSDHDETQNKSQNKRKPLIRLWSKFRIFNNSIGTRKINRRFSRVISLNLAETKRRLQASTRTHRQKRGIMDNVSNLVKYPWRKNIHKDTTLTESGKDADKLIAMESQTHVQYVAPPSSMPVASNFPVYGSQMDLPSLASELNVSVNQILRPVTTTSVSASGSGTKTAFIPLIDQHNLINKPMDNELNILAQALRSHKQNQNHLTNFHESPLELMNEAETAGSGQDSSYPAIRMPMAHSHHLVGSDILRNARDFSYPAMQLGQLGQGSNQQHNSIFYTPIESDAPLEPPANDPHKTATKQKTMASKPRDRIKSLLKSSRKPLDKLMRMSRFSLGVGSASNFINRTASTHPAPAESNLNNAQSKPIDGQASTLSLAQTLNAVVSPSLLHMTPSQMPSSLENFNKFAIPLQSWYQQQLRSGQTTPVNMISVKNVGQQQRHLLPLANHVSQSLSPYSLITSESQAEINRFPYNYRPTMQRDPQRLAAIQMHLNNQNLLASQLSRLDFMNRNHLMAPNSSLPMNIQHSQLIKQGLNTTRGNVSVRGSQRADATNNWNLLYRPISALQDLHRNLLYPQHDYRLSGVKRTTNFDPPLIQPKPNSNRNRLITNHTFDTSQLELFDRWRTDRSKLAINQRNYHQFLPQTFQLQRQNMINEPQRDFFSASASNTRPPEYVPVRTEFQSNKQRDANRVTSSLDETQAPALKPSDQLHDFSLMPNSDQPENPQPNTIISGSQTMHLQSPVIPSLEDQQSNDQIFEQQATSFINTDPFNPLVGSSSPFGQQNKQLKLIKFIPSFNTMANKFRQHLFQTFRLNPLASVVKRPQLSPPSAFISVPHQQDEFISQASKHNDLAQQMNQISLWNQANYHSAFDPMSNQQDDLQLSNSHHFNSNGDQLILDNPISGYSGQSGIMTSIRNVTNQAGRPIIAKNFQKQPMMRPYQLPNALHQTSGRPVGQSENFEEFVYTPNSLKQMNNSTESSQDLNVQQPTIYEQTNEVIIPSVEHGSQTGYSSHLNGSGQVTSGKHLLMKPIRITKGNQMTEINSNLITSDGNYIREDERQSLSSDTIDNQQNSIQDNYRPHASEISETRGLRQYIPEANNSSDLTIHHHHHLFQVDNQEAGIIRDFSTAQQPSQTHDDSTGADPSIFIKHLTKSEANQEAPFEVVEEEVARPSSDGQQIVEVKYELERVPSSKKQAQIIYHEASNKTQTHRPHLVVYSGNSNKTIPIEVSSGPERHRVSDYQVIKASQVSSLQPKTTYIQTNSSSTGESAQVDASSDDSSDTDYQSLGPQEVGNPAAESGEDEQQEQANGQRQQVVYQQEGGSHINGVVSDDHSRSQDDLKNHDNQEPQIVYEESLSDLGVDQQAETTDSQPEQDQTRPSIQSSINLDRRGKKNLPTYNRSIHNGQVESSNRLTQVHGAIKFGRKSTNKEKTTDNYVYVDQPVLVSAKSDSKLVASSEPKDPKTDEQPAIFVSVKPQRVVQVRNRLPKGFRSQESQFRVQKSNDSTSSIRLRGGSNDGLEKRNASGIASATASSSLSYSITPSRNSSSTTAKPASITSELVMKTRESLTTTRNPKAKIRWQGVSGIGGKSSMRNHTNSIGSRWLQPSTNILNSAETTKNELKHAWIVGGMTHQTYGSINQTQGSTMDTLNSTRYVSQILANEGNVTNGLNQTSPLGRTQPIPSNHNNSYQNTSVVSSSYSIGHQTGNSVDYPPTQVGPHTWRLDGAQASNMSTHMEPGTFNTPKSIKRASNTTDTNTTTFEAPANHKPASNVIDSRTAPTSFRLDSNPSGSSWSVSTTSQAPQLPEPTSIPLATTKPIPTLNDSTNQTSMFNDSSSTHHNRLVSRNIELDSQQLAPTEKSNDNKNRISSDSEAYLLHYANDRDFNSEFAPLVSTEKASRNDFVLRAGESITEDTYSHDFVHLFDRHSND